MGIRLYDERPEALLEAMLLIRAYEEKAAALQAESGTPGTCTAVGQEAAAVGVVAALGADELILTNHRSAGHLLARGADPGRLLAEVMGRRGGYCKGKSGSLHVSARELGVVLTSTIVGGELALATGVALAQKQLRRPGAVVCFFGDGAACEGRFHESLNLAALWGLPVLYVCENNEWQAFVHRRETMLAEGIAGWAGNYGIDHATVDGNDVEQVRAVAAAALESVRGRGRPFLLEARTYRLRGHFEPDDQAYVDTDELAAWRARDPLPRMEARLLASGRCDAGAITAMKAAVAAQVAAAHAFAIDSPYPALEELTTDVYA
ncbi:thiamine pyrophosphate-dependent dehydrogenase E1 component subunit alpha [Azoarcus olearius]|uniref:Acetion dehydrogenase, alpha subunit n=1 Tax=Azoarcus sp. (strain BH72) TaxID=418699 RepID=A1K5Q1_AZOSB|nr:thiamine pyrophosphate-dependent dehydrogenase E1 component subunit alpha [Azoarcus olearius]CAL94156.1 putative acetion dehydrogenase, alpha subunit [Azoarcus olearius]